MLIPEHSLPPTVQLEEREHACSTAGWRHIVLTARRRHAACYGVYVGHPISGIRVSRILTMQDEVRSLFESENAGSVQRVSTYFPMRTTHLDADELGANVYDASPALFARTRAYTVQNRLDALCNADGVLVNYELMDDAGQYRVSKGMPFDWGWARAAGKPVVVVIGHDNPNLSNGLLKTAAFVTPVLAQGVRALNKMLPHAACRAETWKMAVEIFDFGNGSAPALDLIAHLAEADMRKHTQGGRAIISILPRCSDGAQHPSFHGQVEQVSDWVVESLEEAVAIARGLFAA